MITRDLLSDLSSITENNIRIVEQEILKASPNKLTFKSSDNSWNVLECLEHLNLYGDFYIPELKKALKKASDKGMMPKETFKPGWLGEYFTNMMKLPKTGNIKKYPTFKDKNPIFIKLPHNVVERFLKQQQEILGLLKTASTLSIEKVRIPVTIAPLIKLKLGDGLRFVIYHNERHMAQAMRALALSNEVLKSKEEVMH